MGKGAVLGGGGGTGFNPEEWDVLAVKSANTNQSRSTSGNRLTDNSYELELVYSSAGLAFPAGTVMDAVLLGFRPGYAANRYEQAARADWVMQPPQASIMEMRLVFPGYSFTVSEYNYEMTVVVSAAGVTMTANRTDFDGNDMRPQYHCFAMYLKKKA